jgi:hypothetical protein
VLTSVGAELSLREEATWGSANGQKAGQPSQSSAMPPFRNQTASGSPNQPPSPPRKRRRTPTTSPVTRSSADLPPRSSRSLSSRNFCTGAARKASRVPTASWLLRDLPSRPRHRALRQAPPQRPPIARAHHRARCRHRAHRQRGDQRRPRLLPAQRRSPQTSTPSPKRAK